MNEPLKIVERVSPLPRRRFTLFGLEFFSFVSRFATQTEEKASHLFEESFGTPPVCPHCAETVRDAISQRIMVVEHDEGEGE